MEILDRFGKGLCEPNPYTDAGYPAAPTVDEYLQAIGNGLAESRTHNIYLRKMIWWFFNDRVRKKEPPFLTENEEVQWRENCLALIALLGTSRIENLFTLAELYPNLGTLKKACNCYMKLKTQSAATCRQTKGGLYTTKKQALSLGFS